MASFEQREVVTRHLEWLVPRGPRGVSIREFQRALTAAAYEANRREPGTTNWDDWAYVDADDQYLIIRLSVKE